MAKNNATQKRIGSFNTGDRYADEIEQMMNRTESRMEISPEYIDTTMSLNFHRYVSTKAFYEDDISDIYSFENSSDSSSIIYAEPQGDFHKLPSNSRRYTDPSLETSASRGSISSSASAESNQSTSFNSMQHTAPEYYLDPFPRRRYGNRRKKKQIVHDNQKCPITLPHDNDKLKRPTVHSTQSENTLQIGDALATSKNELNNQKVNIPSAPSNDNHYSEIVNCLRLADYFDPFHSLKCYKSNILNKDVCKVGGRKLDNIDNGTVNCKTVGVDAYSVSDTQNITSKCYFDPFRSLKPEPDIPRTEEKLIGKFGEQECNVIESQTVDDDVNSSQTKVPKQQDTKSPFQILYEKVFKKFRLVPRCSIEGSQNGFKCRLVVDTLIGVGEGVNKRQAKTNAAIDLLRQIE